MYNLLSKRENGFIKNLKLRGEIEKILLARVDLLESHCPERASSVNILDIDSNKQFLLSGSSNGKMTIFDLHSMGLKLKKVTEIDVSHPERHQSSVTSVQWYPVDPGLFSSSGSDQTFKLWDSNSLKLAAEFVLDQPLNCHKISERTLLVAIGSNSNKLRLFDLRSGLGVQQLAGHSGSVLDLFWSPYRSFHLISSGKDGQIITWDVRNSRSTLLLFDIENHHDNNPSPRAHYGMINSLIPLKNGRHFLSFGTDDAVRVWDLLTGKNVLFNFGTIENKSKTKIQISSNERFAFIPSQNQIVIIDVSKGTQLKKLNGHFDQVNCCLQIPSSCDLISGSKDKNIFYWSCLNKEKTEDLEITENYLNIYRRNSSLREDSW